MHRFRSPRFRAWLAVAVWDVLISIFSTNMFSGEHTGSVLLPILRALLPSAEPEQLLAVHALVRKGAHVFEYAVLGALLVQALRQEGLRGAALAATAILFGVVSASVDEWHQEFVPSRTSSARDVAVDATGVMAGVGLAFARMAGSSSPPAEN